MTIHDLTKTQKIIKDTYEDNDIQKGCSCSEKINNLEAKIRQLETIILRGTIENGRDKNILNISK
jgi:hypothetical protein|tara:strand:+ start:986 stop:1180 length:195 start_codon:yes stop_codon:yes gene_type:complete